MKRFIVTRPDMLSRFTKVVLADTLKQVDGRLEFYLDGDLSEMFAVRAWESVKEDDGRS